MTIPTQEDLFMNAIRQAITEATEAAVDQAIREAQDQIAGRLSEITAGVALRVMQQISMERIGPELLIHVKIDGLK